MKIYSDITQTIGKTPLVKLKHLGQNLPGEILLKLEFFNPLGSVKDRIGWNLIHKAEERGLLGAQKDLPPEQRKRVLEPTSGNTGIALAFVCASKKYPLTLVMPETMSHERRTLLLLLGADIILTPGSLGMKGAVTKAQELFDAEPEKYFMPLQFENPDNPQIHWDTTGTEVWEDTDGEVDILIAGVGTGGTITGLGGYLKSKNPAIKVIAIEPQESAVLSGQPPGPHKIQGIGAGFIPPILDLSLVDQIERVSSSEAIACAKQVIREEGIPVGISSGAAIAVALREAAKEENRGRRIVCLIPSYTERYLSTALAEEENQRALRLPVMPPKGCSEPIPFHCPPKTSKEMTYLQEVLRQGRLSGEGPFNKKCIQWFRDYGPTQLPIMTPSCTSALEMAMILIDLQPGDEVVMPSFTFTSTANAVALFGGVPVFIDIDPKTMNMDVSLIKEALSPRTRAILPVHYGAQPCLMDPILDLARSYPSIYQPPHPLWVIEDAAQGIFSYWKEKPLGYIGDLGAISFHETKNLGCGEGGVLLVNNPSLVERAEMIRDKGTNRQKFLSGQIDKYTWTDKGSSYLMPETSAAFLLSQLEEGPRITERRKGIWETYHQGLAPLETQGFLERPSLGPNNGHIYYILLPTTAIRNQLMKRLQAQGISAVYHYIPLHSTPIGTRLGRLGSPMRYTDEWANRLLRLPLYEGLSEDRVHRVIEAVTKILRAS